MRTFGIPTARVLILAGLFGMTPTRPLAGQGLDHVKANYTKYEHMVPMRDGVKLFTAVYAPKDHSKKYPILFNRTPYGAVPFGVDRYKSDLGPSPHFGREGYIFVYQDVRGRWMSEGEFVNVRPIRPHTGDPKVIDESTDAKDTIEWLLAHVENHNGRVGMWGISYPGYYTASALVDPHPALKAASPQAPIADWFIGDDWHHNGTLFLPHAFNFMAVFGHPRPAPTKKSDRTFDHGTPDGYQFFLRMGPLANADAAYFKGDVGFWKELMRHDTYDAFWKERNLRPHLKSVRPAVMTVGGWFDAENLFGALETYRTIESSNPGASNTLVMGPWYHGGWSRDSGDSLGAVRFNAKTSHFYAEHIELPFFEFHLKGTKALDQPEAWVFETGRNEWHSYRTWPPESATPKSLFLSAKGKLAFDPPEEAGDAVFDEYRSDPAKPVPYIDEFAVGMKREYMVADQRFASRRPDVLTYQTEPLLEDVTLVGPIRAKLNVSTSGTDSDWVVKVIDVYPDDSPDPDPNPSGVRMGGYEQLIRGEVMRGKFRRSYETPEPFEPGVATEVNFTLQDVNHTFRPGHRIMVQVQSTWFPLVDRNPQKFVGINTANESDFQVATQRLYRSKDKTSRLEVLTLP